MQFLTHISFLQENKFYIKEFPVKWVRGKIWHSCKCTIYLCTTLLKSLGNTQGMDTSCFLHKTDLLFERSNIGRMLRNPNHLIALVPPSLLVTGFFQNNCWVFIKMLTKKKTEREYFFPSVITINQTSPVTLKTFKSFIWTLLNKFCNFFYNFLLADKAYIWHIFGLSEQWPSRPS